MPGTERAPVRPRRARGAWLSWLFGISLLVTLVLVVRGRAEERAFARLLESARPAWLALAVLLQAATYVAEAGVWRSLVATTGRRASWSAFVGLAFAKLFIDQAVPSGGWSGTFVVVHSLERRGVSRAWAMAGVIIDLAGYYLAYLAALGAALGLLGALGRLRLEIVVPVVVFSVFAASMIALPSLVARGAAMGGLRRLRPLRRLVDLTAESDPGTLRNPRLWAACFACELAIFLLDGASLWTCLKALGVAEPLPVTFAAYMVAALARTMGILPGGLGTFEGVSVAALRLCGVPLGAALGATLLFRGLSFWLPLLPGLVFARRESRA